MASFWFLETIALHVLRYQRDLDDYYLSVLVSWLAGEMTLIRDKKHPREEFFGEMKEIFDTAADRMSEQNRLPYWHEILGKIETEDEDVEGEEELSAEDQPSSVGEETSEFSSEVDPVLALNIVIVSTYDMYASELRYALLYAVFVEPVQVTTYHLPFTLRTPRPVKLAQSKTLPFKVQLQNSLAKGQSRKQKKKASGKVKSKLDSSALPPTPTNSLTDEQILLLNRRYILPLIEAKEAPAMFTEHRDDVEQ
ncbi:uncharacterized protein LOC143374031 [Andrena cerasifolii]|uniref:uncharacterized protein LOC143374031 n=1 Tax=Andrena cerasifolii TaxID=2819439 RepID=UPI004038263E